MKEEHVIIYLVIGLISTTVILYLLDPILTYSAVGTLWGYAIFADLFALIAYTLWCCAKRMEEKEEYNKTHCLQCHKKLEDKCPQCGMAIK